MNENFIWLGFALIAIGFVIISVSSLGGQSERGEKGESDVFIGGFIGFIPFGFSNNKTLFIAGTALTLFALAIILLLRYLR